MVSMLTRVPVGVVSIKFVNCHQFRQFYKVFFFFLNAFYIDFDMNHVEVEAKNNNEIPIPIVCSAQFFMAFASTTL